VTYSNILERSPLLVQKRIVDPIERVEPLNHMPKHRMLPVEILDIVREGDEELGSAPCRLGRRDGHGDGSLADVLEGVADLGGEVSRWWRRWRRGERVEVRGEGLAACSRGGGVACLGDEVLGY
jgi:hypothetical protein